MDWLGSIRYEKDGTWCRTFIRGWATHPGVGRQRISPGNQAEVFFS